MYIFEIFESFCGKNDLTFSVLQGTMTMVKRLVYGLEHQLLRFLEHQIVSVYYIVRGKNSIASIKHQTARGPIEKF